MISGMRVRRRSSAGGKAGYKFYRWVFNEWSAKGNYESEALIYELGLYTPDNPSGVPTGGTPSSSSTTSGYGVEYAFDGNLNSRMQFADGSAPEGSEVTYEFNLPVIVSSYGVSAQVQSLVFIMRRAPRSWQFLGSNDGTDWDLLDEQTGQTWTSNVTTKTFDL